MTERPSIVLGLMSGTSLDGIDAAVVRFSDPTHVELLGFATRPYESDERAAIRRAFDGATAPELARLHVRLAEWSGEAANEALRLARITPVELTCIALHGQTIWHEPPLVSWQLGEPAVLAERFGVRVVSNFRARDVAAGGQGAPLVPLADVLLFGSTEHPRILVNIGGMANLTYVVRRAQDEGAFAFDTGPGMAVIDAVARLVDPTLPYDVDGRLAAAGTPSEAVVAALLAEPFFDAPPPKSTGRETFNDAYARALHARVPGADGVATAVELTARSIAAAIGRWAPGDAEIVVSGGGCHHPALMAALARRLTERAGRAIELRRFDDLFFTGDAKEAVAFALLGYLTLHGQPGNLPAATGASGARVLGTVTPA